jgi:hypothetical protein
VNILNEVTSKCNGYLLSYKNENDRSIIHPTPGRHLHHHVIILISYDSGGDDGGNDDDDDDGWMRIDMVVRNVQQAYNPNNISRTRGRVDGGGGDQRNDWKLDGMVVYK